MAREAGRAGSCEKLQKGLRRAVMWSWLLFDQTFLDAEKGQVSGQDKALASTRWESALAEQLQRWPWW